MTAFGSLHQKNSDHEISLEVEQRRLETIIGCGAFSDHTSDVLLPAQERPSTMNRTAATASIKARIAAIQTRAVVQIHVCVVAVGRTHSNSTRSKQKQQATAAQ